jgi:hypothetical protein
MTITQPSPIRASSALLKTAIELLEDSISMLEGQHPFRASAIQRLIDDAEKLLTFSETNSEHSPLE